MLPRLILIADRFTTPDVAARVQEAAEAGVKWIHLRDHDVASTVFEERAYTLVQRLRVQQSELRISINTHANVAGQGGWDLHVGMRGPSVQEARQRLPEAIIGFSAHDVNEGPPAVEAGADYLLFSPIFPTTSKQNAVPKGMHVLRQMCDTVRDTPVFALGGVTPDRVAQCVKHGAYGIAVLSGILAAPRVKQAVHAYHQALADAVSHLTSEDL